MMHRPLVGDILDNRYLLTDNIGPSRISRVYLALDTALDNAQVALRHVTANPDSDALQTESSMLERLHHPNLPKVIDLITDQRFGAFFVIQYIRGDDLELRLHQQHSPFPVDTVLVWADDLLNALDYLHQQTPLIIHANICPRNLKQHPDGHIVLVEPAFATHNDTNNHPTNTMRPPNSTSIYAPLEQRFSTIPLSPQSDIYALGATLYHLLTATEPPDAATRQMALAAGDSDPLRPAHLLTDSVVPERLAYVLHKAMALSPERRYASAADMRHALQQVRQPQHVRIVGQTSDAAYQTIQAALHDATPETVILIEPGTYQESIVIEQPVTIIGQQNQGDVIIQSTDGPCITVRAASARVSGLTLRGRGGLSGQRFYAVNIPQGNVELTHCDISSDTLAGIGIYSTESTPCNPLIQHCTIHSCHSAGILLYAGAQGRIMQCDIAGNLGPGISIEDGDPEIKDCRIHRGRNGPGIHVYRAGRGRIEQCEIYGNPMSGVLIEAGGHPLFHECRIFANAGAAVEICRGGKATIQQCQMYNGIGRGVYIHSKGEASLHQCTIHNNASLGVEMKASDTIALHGCQIYSNRKGGVLLTENSKATIDSCTIYGHAEINIKVGEDCQITLQHSTISQGSGTGIAVRPRGSGHINNCTIHNHFGPGIEIERGGNPTIINCHINHNNTALYAHRGAQGCIEYSDLRNNRQGAWQGKHRLSVINNTIES